jgi:hypothetical protein
MGKGRRVTKIPPNGKMALAGVVATEAGLMYGEVPLIR